MARKKKVLLEDGIDKREVGYYSTPSFISEYLTNEMISLNPNGKLVLDPAVGKEELLPYFYNKGKIIHGIDIIRHKNDYEYCDFKQMNFIDHYNSLCTQAIFKSLLETEYDYIIANPPYNCHEISYIRDNKKWLSSLFEVGAHNMYSMFLSAIIDIAKDGCIIGVIIADSFLTASVHGKLRNKILKECSIHQIILCPTDLFKSQNADVRTCILLLQKGKDYQKKVQVCNRPINCEVFRAQLQNKQFAQLNLEQIILPCSKLNEQIVIGAPYSIIDLFKNCKSIGELFKCITCISTGNDSKYLSKERISGFSVPFYKNPASRKFKTHPDAYLIDTYLTESTRIKDFMVRNKAFLREEGIACSSMGLPFSAVYLPSDAVTGVNPSIFPPKKDIYWLISYLNSSLVTYIVRAVLIRSNMVTSGYVNCIPVVEFNDNEKLLLSEIAQDAIKGRIQQNEAINNIDKLIFNKLSFCQEVINEIVRFTSNLQQSV